MRISYIWRQDDWRRRLVKIANVEWLTLQADIHGLQWVQAHRDTLALLLWWLHWLLSAHAHLTKLLCHASHALRLLHSRRNGRGISRRRSLIARWSTVLRLLEASLLRRGALASGITISWLLWHTIWCLPSHGLRLIAICRLCRCLLTGICSTWRWWTSRLLRVGSGSELVGLSSIPVLLLVGWCGCLLRLLSICAALWTPVIVWRLWTRHDARNLVVSFNRPCCTISLMRRMGLRGRGSGLDRCD